ncbi:MAG: PKD domain-containing protein, partial [Bacteroidetes bacterium]|nr:PKD domain-containing protein [Bacteroidota bacterium]
VSGTSQPGDIIEIFGSTGAENANEYLQTVTADGSGNWTAQLMYTSFQNIVATATDTQGNTSSISLAVPIPDPCIFSSVHANAGNDIIIEYGSEIQIGGAFVYGYTYLWSPATWLNNPNISNPITTPDSTLIYNLLVTDQNGCTSSDHVRITVADEIPVLSPNSIFDTVVDKDGNKYRLQDIMILNNVEGFGPSGTKSYMLCNAGYFDLYFEQGSGMENNTADNISRRTVMCQVFTDLSDFIISPLSTNGMGNKVNIWVRDFANIPGVGDPETSLVLGIATSFYNLPAGAPGISGISDNEVWKTIISGTDSYTNVTTPIITQGGQTAGISGSFFHGVIALNFANESTFHWHASLSPNTSNNNTDMYTMALHEALHLLGIGSLINQNGQSKMAPDYNYYSRWDSFLQSPSGQQLISNTGQCGLYGYQFNPALNPGILTPSPASCSNSIIYAGTTVQPVFTSDSWSASSLSHLTDECHIPNPYTNDSYYVMSDGYNPAVTLMKRYPKPEERIILCDLGYAVNSTYGAAANSTYYDYQTTACSGIQVAGINDGINSNGTFQFVTTTGTPINFTGSEILSNDYCDGCTNLEFECIEEIYGLGSLTCSSGTTGGNNSTVITFTPNSTGTTLLRYIPKTASGKRGNITYVFIRINGSCPAIPCNMFTNSGFESTNFPCSTLDQQPNAINCWTFYTGSPDLFGTTCPFSSMVIPNYYFSNTGVYAWNYPGTVNNHFIGLMWFRYSLTNPNAYNEESVQTRLTSPLVPDETYILTFMARVADGDIYTGNIPVQLAIAASQATLAPAGSNFDASSSNTDITVLDPSIIVPDNNAWNPVTVQFTCPQGVYNLQNFIIGLDISTSITPYKKYVFIDDVKLVPQPTAVLFTPPEDICINEIIPDLEVYTIPPGGNFTGSNGISCSGGTCSFDASLAGTGYHTIFYNYTDNIGCVQHVPAQIYVNDFLNYQDVAVDWQTDCNAVGEEIMFSNLSSPENVVYNWNFGDGSVSDEESPAYIYSEDGYFCVSLEVSNACNLLNRSEPIFILADNCSCLYPYYTPAYEEDYTFTPASADPTLYNGDVIRKTIYIEDNTTVTINAGANVAFGPEGKIVIEPGGHLIIGSNAVLSSLPPCTNMWQGVEVWSSDYSGRVTINSNARIMDAHIGVLLGSRALWQNCSPTNLYGSFYSGEAGGAVEADNAKFIDCGIGIYGPSSWTDIDNSASSLINCYFYTMGTLNDPKYNSLNDPHYQANNQLDHNPFINHSNELGITNFGIRIEKRDDIQFNNNKFDDLYKGLESYDSRYNIYKGWFKNCRYGIYIVNTSSNPNKNHLINEVYFDNIPGTANTYGAGITIESGRGDRIKWNDFGSTMSTQLFNSLAIKMHQSSLFKISGNNFYRFQQGVLVYNSTKFGGEISPDAVWGENRFYQCMNSIKTGSFNNRLKIKCNTFLNTPESNILYTQNWFNTGYLASQGAMPVGQDNTCQAGNEFYPDYRKHIVSYTKYIYFRHSINNYSYDPQCIWPTAGYPVLVKNTGVSKQPTSCDAPTLAGIGPEEILGQLDVLSAEIETLREEYEQIAANLDKGNTEALITAINAGISSGKLKNLLTSNSPLSDEVLIGFMEKTSMPPGNFKNVMELNLPVTETVEPVFNDYLTVLPPGIAGQLRELNAYNPAVITLAEAARRISEKEMERNSLTGAYLDTLQSAGNTGEIKAFLAQENTTEAGMMLTGMLIEEGSYNEALAVLEQMGSPDPETAEWIDLTTMIIGLGQDQKTYYEITDEQEQYIRSLAYECPKGPASSVAAGILRMIKDEEAPECSEAAGDKSLAVSVPEQAEERAYSFRFAPNPARDKVWVRYGLPSGSDGRLNIYSADGKLAGEFPLDASLYSVEISVKGWQCGVYTCVIETEGTEFERRKLVVIK